jgi:hypothetical protein
MTDLRQGVTPTQHEVLDMIEERAVEWSAKMTWEEKLADARGCAADATRLTSLKQKRLSAIVAAALLIDAADEISRLIDAKD